MRNRPVAADHISRRMRPGLHDIGKLVRSGSLDCRQVSDGVFRQL